MIRAYVAPTEHPVIWIEVPAGRVDWDYAPGDRSIAGRAYVELTPAESEELREQMQHAEALTRIECDHPSCRSHPANDGGYCVEHGGDR